MRYPVVPQLLTALVVTMQLPVQAMEACLASLPSSGGVDARVMQIGMPAEALATAEKIQSAFAAQPEWAQQFIAKAAPGQALPYHPNMRVSKSEYKSFLVASEHPALVQVGTVSLSAVRSEAGDVRVVTSPATSRFNGIAIAADGRSVVTPLASLDETHAINNAEKDSLTGRWRGTQWSNEATTGQRALAVKFAIGKRTDHGDCIVYYNVESVQEPGEDAFQQVLLFPTR